MILELRQTRPVGPPGLAGARPVVVVPQTSGVACITVSRRSPSDAGIREVFVSVDGETVAVLKHGEAVTHEVPAGATGSGPTTRWSGRRGTSSCVPASTRASARSTARGGRASGFSSCWARRRCI
jgi:hypothetical protein